MRRVMNVKKNAGSLEIGGLVLILLAVLGSGCGKSGSSEPIQTPGICSACQHEAKITVGEDPVSEKWPKECPKCNKDHFYLAMTCVFCKKSYPMKDPNAEKIGMPKACPHCKRDFPRGT